MRIKQLLERPAARTIVIDYGSTNYFKVDLDRHDKLTDALAEVARTVSKGIDPADVYPIIVDDVNYFVIEMPGRTLNFDAERGQRVGITTRLPNSHDIFEISPNGDLLTKITQVTDKLREAAAQGRRTLERTSE